MFDINNYSARLGGVEIRKLTADDWSLAPQVWDNDLDMHAQLLRVPAWGLFFIEGDENPHSYLRMYELDKVREPYGIVRLGDGPLAPHTSVHHRDVVQGNGNVIPYQKISTSPETWQVTADAPFSQLTFKENGEHWIEGKDGSVLDLHAELFPFAIFYHSDSPMASPYFIQFLILTGTYQGRPVRALGGSDRIFVPQNSGESGLLSTPIRKAKYSAITYIHCMLTGVRKDGRKELASFMLTELGAHGLYWLEGEEPYMTTNVSLEADWQKPDYLPEDDQTLAFTRAIWRFDNREVHFTGHWGAKGFGEQVRLEPQGLIEVFGTWYEGKQEYEHDMNFSFFEISRMTRDVLEDLGILS